MFEITWYGHSMWRLCYKNKSIIIDPFDDIGYKLPQNLTCDYLISTHDHHDHNNIALINGDYKLLNKNGIYNDGYFTFETFSVYHDHHKGSKRGTNLMFKITIANHTFLHVGDLGHIPDEKLRKKIGKVECLFLPIGGVYTIDAQEAFELTQLLKPKIVFPMHYKTNDLKFDLGSLNDFTLKVEYLRFHPDNTIKLSEKDFQTEQTIIMDY